jgi:hypothetical protein
MQKQETPCRRRILRCRSRKHLAKGVSCDAEAGNTLQKAYPVMQKQETPCKRRILLFGGGFPCLCKTLGRRFNYEEL